MSRILEGRAPAKVNLGLRVRGRRTDGHHEIESVFAPLDFGDDLTLTLVAARSPRAALHVEAAEGAPAGPMLATPAGPGNLAARAAVAFLEAAGLDREVRIGLVKRIPVAAGLGGGSSDAGTVLRLLAGAFPDALPRSRLHGLALSLGADVPFFLDPRPARVTGVGERIEPLAGLRPRVLLLVNPGVPLPTAEVYRAFDALVPDPGRRSAGRAPREPGEDLANDLEPAAVRLRPELRRLRERLTAAGARAVGMSGSGPTLFGVFASREAARAAAGSGGLAPPLWTRVAATLECG